MCVDAETKTACIPLRDVCVDYLFAGVYAPNWPRNTEYVFTCTTLYYAGFGIFLGVLALSAAGGFGYLVHWRQKDTLRRTGADCVLTSVEQHVVFDNPLMVGDIEEARRSERDLEDVLAEQVPLTESMTTATGGARRKTIYKPSYYGSTSPPISSFVQPAPEQQQQQQQQQPTPSTPGTET